MGIGRCILQSQTMVYKAIALAVQEFGHMDTTLVEELKFVKQRKHITEGLERFVMEAYKDGALSTRETEAILHPMHHQLYECLEELKKCTGGDTADGLDGIVLNTLAAGKAAKKEAEAKFLGLRVGRSCTQKMTGHGPVDDTEEVPVA